MRLRDLKRFVRSLLPNVYIEASRDIPRGIMGMAWLCDGEPVIVYSAELRGRERDLTILHELAHHVLGDTRDRSVPALRPVDASKLDDDAARAELARALDILKARQWREDRADRWAEQTLELLEGGAP